MIFCFYKPLVGRLLHRDQWCREQRMRDGSLACSVQNIGLQRKY